MGFLDLFKVKNEKKGFQVPRAPGSTEAKLPKLPEFPAFKDDLEVFESKQVRKQESELKMRDSMEEMTSPIFVDFHMYKAMMDELAQVDVLLKEDDAIVYRMQEYGNDCEKEYSKFRKQLEDLQRKLIFSDRKLFG